MRIKGQGLSNAGETKRGDYIATISIVAPKPEEVSEDDSEARAIQKSLKSQGVELVREADESGTGPAMAFLFDPDGNPVLLDQH